MDSPNFAEESWEQKMAKCAQYFFNADTDVDIVYDDENGTKIYERKIQYHSDEVLLGLYVKIWKSFERRIPDYAVLLKRLEEEWLDVGESGIAEICHYIGKTHYHNRIKAKLEWTLKDLSFYTHLNSEKTKLLMREAIEVSNAFEAIPLDCILSVGTPVSYEKLMQQMEKFNHKHVHCYVMLPNNKTQCPMITLIPPWHVQACYNSWAKSVETPDSTENLCKEMDGISIETEPCTSSEKKKTEEKTLKKRATESQKKVIKLKLTNYNVV